MGGGFCLNGDSKESVSASSSMKLAGMYVFSFNREKTLIPDVTGL